MDLNELPATVKWELEWIDENVDRYDSVLHALAVKQNILKRHRISELEKALRK